MFYRKRTDPTNQLYRRLVPLVHVRPARLMSTRPMVSFTFDDFPRSAAVHGGRILEAHGARGTFYLSAQPELDSAAAYDPICPRTLENLALAGHELGCHTFSHFDCALASPGLLTQQAAANQAYVDQVLPGYQLRNFAYPYGNVSIAAKRQMADTFRSCRGIHPRVRGRSLDLSLLPSHPLFGPLMSSRLVRRLIDANAARCGWLIFFTHDVARLPSSYGTAISLLEEAVAHAARTGSDILTVDQALDRTIPRRSRRSGPRRLHSARDQPLVAGVRRGIKAR